MLKGKAALIGDAEFLSMINAVEGDYHVSVAVSKPEETTSFLTLDREVFNPPKDGFMAEYKSYYAGGILNKREVVINCFPTVVSGRDVKINAVIRSKIPVDYYSTDPASGTIKQHKILYYNVVLSGNYRIKCGIYNTDPELLRENILSVVLAMTNITDIGDYPEDCYITIINPLPYEDHSCVAAIALTLLGHTCRYPVTGAFVHLNPYCASMLQLKYSKLSGPGYGLIVAAAPDDLFEYDELKPFSANFTACMIGRFLIDGQAVNPIIVNTLNGMILSSFANLPKNVRSTVSSTLVPQSGIAKTTVSNAPTLKKVGMSEFVYTPPTTVNVSVGNNRSTMEVSHILNFNPDTIADSALRSAFTRAIHSYESAPNPDQKNNILIKMGNIIENSKITAKPKIEPAKPNPAYTGMTKTQKTRYKRQQRKGKVTGTNEKVSFGLEAGEKQFVRQPQVTSTTSTTTTSTTSGTSGSYYEEFPELAY